MSAYPPPSRRPLNLPDSVYPHDHTLGHEFFAITGRTDQCDNCGCTVSEATNHPGLKGGRFDEVCRDQKWRCDCCGHWKPHGASTYGFPDVICRTCWRKQEGLLP